MSSLSTELAEVFNKYGVDDATGIPDFLLAEYIEDCLATLNSTVVSLERWRND